MTDQKTLAASGESGLNYGLGDRIIELEQYHGSLRAVARVLGCDAGKDST